MYTQELPIQQAQEGEIYGDKVAFNSDEFQTQLKKYGVDDLFNDNLVIKQDKQKYIFCIGGINRFAVDGKVNLTTFINDFYKKLAIKDSRSVEKKAVIEVSELEKKTKIAITYTETIQDLQALEKEIIKIDNLEEDTTDIENVKYKVERLIKSFEKERDITENETAGWIFNTKYDKKDKGLRKIHKTEINRRLEELNKIKELIETLASNEGKKYYIERTINPEGDKKEVSTITEVKMDDEDAMDMDMTLKQLSERIEEIGKEVPNFITTRNDIVLEEGDTTPYYELIMNNTQDARSIRKALKRINANYAQLDKLSLSAAKRQALQQDLKDLSEYLENYINHPDTFDPVANPFIPKSGGAFAEFCSIDPELKDLAKLNKKAGKPSDGTAKPEYPDGTGGTGGNKTGGEGGNEKGKNQYAESPYDNVKEAFEKGGIGGMLKYGLDKTNMKPDQKQFWGGLGNVAVIGGMVFVGFKMIQSAFNIIFKSNKAGGKGIYDSKNLGWLLGPLAVLGISQGVSGEGPLSLFTGGKLTEMIGGIFGGSKEGDKNGIKYKEGFPGVTALFNGFTYAGMKELLVQDTNGDHIQINPDKYDALLSSFKSKKNTAAVAFLESIGKNDDKHMIDLALKAMMGKDARKNIQDEKNKDKKFNESASNAIARLASVEAYMTQKGYNKLNTETEYLVEEYIANEDADIDDLEDLDKRGDVFYKEETITDKTGLADEVKILANGDTEKEEELLLALNTFYEKWPTSNKSIELIGTWPKITFKTYENTTTIDLQSKSMVGLVTNQKFSSYLELFRATNLTNYIKKLCKDRESTTPTPFHISTPGRDIEFTDPSTFKLDTEIVSAGMGGSLKGVSQVLEDNKQAYCDYLNATTPKFWIDKTVTK